MTRFLVLVSCLVLISGGAQGQIPRSPGEPKNLKSAFEPRVGETAFLSRQPWSNPKPENGPILYVILADPNTQTWQKLKEIHDPKMDEEESRKKFDSMLDSGETCIVPVNVKLKIVAIPDLPLAEAGYNPHQPIEVKILEGPAKGGTFWTSLHNLSSSIDKSTLAPLAEIQARRQAAKRRQTASAKAASRRAKADREAEAARREYEYQLKMAPTYAAIQTEAMRQQSQAIQLQEEQLRLQNLRELNAMIREERAAAARVNGYLWLYRNTPIR